MAHEVQSGGSTCPPAVAARLKGVVLLVDDDAAVRGFVRRALEVQGLTVLPADSPEAAIRLSQSTEDPIDLLLTDLKLPEISGIELTLRVRAMRPTLPVILMSGYPREVVESDMRLVGSRAGFLQKPFRAAQLSEAIRNALGRPNPTSPMPDS